MGTFSFESVFEKAIGFTKKNTVSVLMAGLLFFAFAFVFDSFIGLWALNLLDEMRAEAFASVAAVNPEAARAAADNISRIASLGIIIRFLPLLFSFFLSFCFISLFFPACKNNGLKLRNIIPPAAPFASYVGFICLVILFMAVLILFASRTAMFLMDITMTALPYFVILFFVMGVIYIIGMIRVCFVPFGFLDKISFFESFKQSFLLTRRNGWKLFSLFICLWIINYLGDLIIVGKIFTVPFTVLTLIYAYLELTALPETVAETIQEIPEADIAPAEIN